MTTLEEDLKNFSPKSFRPSEGQLKSMSQRLIEAQELSKLLTRKLEDCGVELAGYISQEQKDMLHSASTGETSFDQTLLARTYFHQKELDRAFQHLISCNKIFSDSLTTFLASLQEQFTSTAGYCEMRNQWLNTVGDHQVPNDSAVDTLHLVNYTDRRSSNARNAENVAQSALSLKNSFANVIKAKVNFDTKFLGFEAVLHNTASGVKPAENLCAFCLNTPQQNSNSRRAKVRSTIRKRTSTRKRRKATRSPKPQTSKRRRRSVRSVTRFGGLGDHSKIGIN